MTLEELQKEWQSVKSTPKSHDELRRMMYAPRTFRIRLMSQKEFRDFLMKAAFIVGLIWAFDLFANWSTGICAAWGIYLFLNEYLGLVYIRLVPTDDTIEQVLRKISDSLQRVLVLSRVANGLVWLTLAIVLGITVPVQGISGILWAVMLLPVMLAANWWIGEVWSERKWEVQQMISTFSDEPENTMGM